MDSILNSIKQLLGIPVADTAFDPDVLIHINSAMAVLNQLGVGPIIPALIVDRDTEWSSFVVDPSLLSLCKTFIFMRTRLIFDPPTTSFVLSAIQRELEELTWRIEHEANPYIPPVIVIVEV